MTGIEAVNVRQSVKDGILSYLLSNGYGHSGRFCNVTFLAQQVDASLTTVTRLCLELASEGRLEYSVPISAETTTRWTALNVEPSEGLNVHCRATLKAQQERYESTLFLLAQLQQGDFRATVKRSWIGIWLAVISLVTSLAAIGWTAFSDTRPMSPIEVIIKSPGTPMPRALNDTTDEHTTRVPGQTQSLMPNEE